MTCSGKPILSGGNLTSQLLISCSDILLLGIFSLIMLADNRDKPNESKFSVVLDAAPISKNSGRLGIDSI